MRRPSPRSTAVAVFIGGCAAAGIAVASASTPAAHHTTPAAPMRSDAGTSTNLEHEHHAAVLRIVKHANAQHPKANRARVVAPASEPTRSGSDDPTDVTSSTEPGDDNGQDADDQGDDNGQDANDQDADDQGDDNSHTATPSESPTSQPGDDDGDNDGDHHGGDQRGGDDNGGDHGGDNSGSGGGDGGSDG